MDSKRDKGTDRKWRFRFKVFVFVLAACFAAGLLIHYTVWPYLHNWCVESLIARFESAPSQANANALVAIVSNQQVTDKQGERILRLLMRPKVTKRETYPVGTMPMISIELPFDIHFRDMTAKISEDVWAEQEHQHGGSSGGVNHFGTSVRLLALHRGLKEPGKYEMELRYSFSVVPSTERTTFEWPSPGVPFPYNMLPSAHTRVTSGDLGKPLYQCEFTVPIDIVVTESQYAERVELTSNPELDRAMRAAFTSKPSNWKYTYTTASGRRKCTGGIEISYVDLPVAAAFEYSYCCADGPEVSRNSEAKTDEIILRAGDSGAFLIQVKDFLFEEPGQYDGTIILRPHPNSAYKDAAIKSIWNGELRFPIDFTIEVEKPGR